MYAHKKQLILDYLRTFTAYTPRGFEKFCTKIFVLCAYRRGKKTLNHHPGEKFCTKFLYYARRKKTIIAKRKFFLSMLQFLLHVQILNFKCTHAHSLCSRLCSTASLSHCLLHCLNKQCSSSLFLTLNLLQVASRCVPRSRLTRGWICPVTSRCTRDVGSSNIVRIFSTSGTLCKER